MSFRDTNKKPTCIRLADSNDGKVEVQLEKTLSSSTVHRVVKVATLGGDEATASCGRFLFGWVTEAGKRELVEVDGQCNKKTATMDVTEHTVWDDMAEWETTADGRVFWANAWDDRGSNKPKTSCLYGKKPKTGRKDWKGSLGYDGYGETQGFVTDSVRISVYRTNANVPATPGSCALPTKASPGPQCQNFEDAEPTTKWDLANLVPSGGS